MIDVNLWEKLNEIQKKKQEALVNSEWSRIQSTLEAALLKAAGEGDRSVTMGVFYEDNAMRLVSLLEPLEKFNTKISSHHDGSHKVHISF